MTLYNNMYTSSTQCPCARYAYGMWHFFYTLASCTSRSHLNFIIIS